MKTNNIKQLKKDVLEVVKNFSDDETYVRVITDVTTGEPNEVEELVFPYIWIEDLQQEIDKLNLDGYYREDIDF